MKGDFTVTIGTNSTHPAAVAVRATLKRQQQEGLPLPSWYNIRTALCCLGMTEAEATDAARAIRAELDRWAH
jgi:hypothetical protein